MSTKYVNVSKEERFVFKLTGATCEITTQRKSGGRWVSLPGAPHYLKQFDEEPHDAYFSKFREKFKAEPEYREEFKRLEPAAVVPQAEAQPAAQPVPPQPVDSISIKAYSAEGYDTMITIRGFNGEAMARALRAYSWLGEHGFTPRPPGAGGQPAAAAAPAPAAQPAAPQPPGDPQASGWCPVHGVAMKWRTGDGGDGWYSHKAVGETGHFWCRGK